MAFVKRTKKVDRAYLSTGSYTNVVENLIPPTRGGMEVKSASLSVQNHEMLPLHQESVDSACMMQAATECFADTEGKTNTHINNMTIPEAN